MNDAPEHDTARRVHILRCFFFPLHVAEFTLSLPRCFTIQQLPRHAAASFSPPPATPRIYLPTPPDFCRDFRRATPGIVAAFVTTMNNAATYVSRHMLLTAQIRCFTLMLDAAAASAMLILIALSLTICCHCYVSPLRQLAAMLLILRYARCRCRCHTAADALFLPARAAYPTLFA